MLNPIIFIILTIALYGVCTWALKGENDKVMCRVYKAMRYVCAFAVVYTAALMIFGNLR